MQPINPAQHADAVAQRVPAPDPVRDGIWSIPLPMHLHGNPFSLSYVIAGDDGSLHLIDTGYGTDQVWDALMAGLTGFGLAVDRIASVFTSHLHPDHLGLSERLRRETGARSGMLRREAEGLTEFLTHGRDMSDETLDRWGVPVERRAELRVPLGPDLMAADPPTVDRRFEPGELLDIPGRSIEVLWTPGHTAGSACLVDRESGLLFTGDTVLPAIYSGLGLGDRTETNPIADYLASLESLARFDELEIAPGHGYRFRGLAERRAALAEHHLSRSRAVASIVRDQPDATAWQVAAQLRWTAGWENLNGFYLFSALAQTELHIGFVRSEGFPG